MLLSAIGHREVPIPEHIDIYHLTREMAPSEKTALECVMEVDEARIQLEREAERLAHEDCEFQQLIKCTWSSLIGIVRLEMKIGIYLFKTINVFQHPLFDPKMCENQ